MSVTVAAERVAQAYRLDYVTRRLTFLASDLTT